MTGQPGAFLSPEERPGSASRTRRLAIRHTGGVDPPPPDRLTAGGLEAHPPASKRRLGFRPGYGPPGAVPTPLRWAIRTDLGATWIGMVVFAAANFLSQRQGAMLCVGSTTALVVAPLTLLDLACLDHSRYALWVRAVAGLILGWPVLGAGVLSIARGQLAPGLEVALLAVFAGIQIFVAAACVFALIRMRIDRGRGHPHHVARLRKPAV